MNYLSTLPSTAEQARHALLLLGSPAPARLVVDVHGTFFDGDLSVPALVGLVRGRVPGFCRALIADLTPARGLIALAEWPLERRIVTPAVRRADALARVVRIVEFVAAQRHSGRCAERLLRELALGVPYGPEALDLGEAARGALADPRLTAQVAAEEPVRAAATRRAAELSEWQQLYGVSAVPHQRGRG